MTAVDGWKNLGSSIKGEVKTQKVPLEIFLSLELIFPRHALPTPSRSRRSSLSERERLGSGTDLGLKELSE